MSTVPQPTETDTRKRSLWLVIRSAIIMVVGALDDYYGVQRAIQSRDERRQQHERDRIGTH